MRIHETKVFTFAELSGEAKETAINECRDYNVCYSFWYWYESIYDDAEQIGIKITEFDIDRGRIIKGDFISDPEDVARRIVANHGPDCDTRKTASTFLEALESETAAHESKQIKTFGEVPIGDTFEFDNAYDTYRKISPMRYQDLLGWVYLERKTSRPVDFEQFNESEAYNDLCREFKHDILSDYWQMLNSEYDYQTSDEAIREMIEVNEYEFTETGERF